MSKTIIENTHPCDRHHTSTSTGDGALKSNENFLLHQNPIYNKAACIIQRTWRTHVDTAVFKHLKKLVSFHNQGDPRLFLKFINPAEAKILDAASGALIRFRLGGTTYPPNIYYKIYTRAPIVDMCASSPRDYTQSQQKKPRHIHNGQMICDDDHSGWYQRVENNGWRILSCQISLFEDPITQDTNCKKTEFHYCKMNRQQDVARKKKIRKIEWMRKMCILGSSGYRIRLMWLLTFERYAEGLGQASAQHSETALLAQKSTQTIMNSLETIEPDSVSEDEVDELLAWANALNFDEYVNEWRDLGTSSYSIPSKDKLSFLPVLETCDHQMNQDDSEVVTQHQGST